MLAIGRHLRYKREFTFSPVLMGRSDSSRHPPGASLENGNRVAVVGGGPAGSFFSYFFLKHAARVGLEVAVDIYEPRNFFQSGPAGCNMCGGIISESLVQLLSTEGIVLPTTVVQRGIDSYVLHMDTGAARIDPPGREKRIAAVHRGAGPRGCVNPRWNGFDGHLLKLAVGKGANVLPERVEKIWMEDGKPAIATKNRKREVYELLVGATGVNGPGIKLLQAAGIGYQPPTTTKTFICELPVGAEAVERYLGASMHVFLLNLPRLEFAAMIPKGDYVTVVMLGSNVDKELVQSFLSSPKVRVCLPPDWEIPPDYCRCFPSINIRGCPEPFADRVVLLGDSGENRLYKDGIGGAYRTAKAAASAAVFEGVSRQDFGNHYLPVCRALRRDNTIGKFVFMMTHIVQRVRPSRAGMLRMLRAEQASGGGILSGVLWDTFTGSASYQNIFMRTLHPRFMPSLLYHCAAAMVRPTARQNHSEEKTMRLGDLGRGYSGGEAIVRQGEAGDCMYVIQAGRVEVIREENGREVKLAELGEGDFFGEMALFEQEVRSATVRPIGEARVLSIDKRMLLRKIHEDPTLAFRIMEHMSRRIRQLNGQLASRAAGA